MSTLDAMAMAEALHPTLPAGAACAVCSVADILRPTPGAFVARPYRHGDRLPVRDGENTYLGIAVYRHAAGEPFRRTMDNVVSINAVMVDDLRTKIPAARVDRLPPMTAELLTSPGNGQGFYRLAEPCRDPDLFNRYVRAYVRALTPDGRDPGMAGATRIGRLPRGWNTKPRSSGPFQVQLVSLDEGRAYTLDELLRAFGGTLEADPSAAGWYRMPIAPEDRNERIEHFKAVVALFRERRMVIGRPSERGWMPVICPWAHEHEERHRTGAALRLPAAENGFYGAFRCHHACCSDPKRGWRHVTDWADAEIVAEMDARDAAWSRRLAEGSASWTT